LQKNGAVPDRAAVQEVQLAIAAKRDAIDIEFWRAVLGYSPMAEDNAVDPLGHGSTIWMQEIDEAKPFPSLRLKGQKPPRANMLVADHLQPAARKAGIVGQVGFHTLPRTLASALVANGNDPKLVQELTTLKR
jgi:integrase